MIAQDQIVLVAEVRDQSRLLVLVQRKPLIVVISDRGEGEQRLLRDRKQPVLLRGDGYPVSSVQMHHTYRILARGMDRAVNREARGIDGVRALHRFVAV